MLGWHWLAQVHGVPVVCLGREAVVLELLGELPAALGLQVVGSPVVAAIEGGLAGMVILAESHCAVHTSIAEGAAFVDVFSCRRPVDVHGAEAVVARVLGGTVQARLVRRGPTGGA